MELGICSSGHVTPKLLADLLPLVNWIHKDPLNNKKNHRLLETICKSYAYKKIHMQNVKRTLKTQ
jgi:hypothetical protein